MQFALGLPGDKHRLYRLLLPVTSAMRRRIDKDEDDSSFLFSFLLKTFLKNFDRIHVFSYPVYNGQFLDSMNESSLTIGLSVHETGSSINRSHSVCRVIEF